MARPSRRGGFRRRLHPLPRLRGRQNNPPRHPTKPHLIDCLNFLYSIGDAAAEDCPETIPILLEHFLYSIGDAVVAALREYGLSDLADTFNTPLETHWRRFQICHRKPKCIFQYSVGDAANCGVAKILAQYSYFQYSIGDADRLRNAAYLSLPGFQYSTGDAGATGQGRYT